MNKKLVSACAATALFGSSLLGAAVAGGAAQAAPESVEAPAAKIQTSQITGRAGTKPLDVMAVNLYIGGNVGDVVEAAAADDTDNLQWWTGLLQAAKSVYGTSQATDFRKRAKWIAKTIAARKPDLVGLNELTRLKTVGGLPEYDYLKILLGALRAEGMDYKVGGVVENVNFELLGFGIPYVDFDGKFPNCAPPTKIKEILDANNNSMDVFKLMDCQIKVMDRDAIIYNAKNKKLKPLYGKKGFPKLKKSGEAEGYQGHYSLDYQKKFEIVDGLPPLSVNRGWVAAPFKYGKKKLTFITSHLETEGQPDGVSDLNLLGYDNWPSLLQMGEAREMVKASKKLAKKTQGRIVYAGDTNSDANKFYSPTYEKVLTKYFEDTWMHDSNNKVQTKENGLSFQGTVDSGDSKVPVHGVGATCCHGGALDSEHPLDLMDPVQPTRIDLVLTRGAKSFKGGTAILGTKDYVDESAQPRWESDHLFYSAKVKLTKPPKK